MCNAIIVEVFAMKAACNANCKWTQITVKMLKNTRWVGGEGNVVVKLKIKIKYEIFMNIN